MAMCENPDCPMEHDMDEVSCEDALENYRNNPTRMGNLLAEVRLYVSPEETYFLQYRMDGGFWQEAEVPDHMAQMIPVYMGMLQQGE